VKRLAAFAIVVTGLATGATANAANPGLYHAAASSSNWAGYAVSGTSFTDVKGTWVQPAASCPARSTGFAAFWVGIGGYSGGNGGLEQIGTESDCSSGTPTYGAWYELLPAASIGIPLTVSAGDTVSAEVSVNDSLVTLTITNVTTGATFTTQQTPSVLDTSSAEWIAEAPSQCSRSSCTPLPLANFGTVQFSGSSTTAAGHVGTITDATWSATAIQLNGGAGLAVPATLSGDGASFSVAWQRGSAAVTAPRRVRRPVRPPRRHH
jgi:peptidase A4-like protein